MRQEIADALVHVQGLYPTCSAVTFDTEEGFEYWHYTDKDGGSIIFDDKVDHFILVDALDAAWEDYNFPVTFNLRDITE